MAEKWRVNQESDGFVEPDVYDLEITDAVNRFARKAEIKILDFDGVKHKDYTKGTSVLIEVSPTGEDADFFDRFGGFVANVERDDKITKVVCYGFDLWLRKRLVLRTFTDTYISDILQELIVDLTPLDWDATKVDVFNDEKITRQWKGEKLSSVVGELASMSYYETFGADDYGTFFFQPRETESAPVDLTDYRILEGDFDEEAAAESNQITIYYNDGNDAITVADREDQKELADELGRSNPVITEMTAAYPEISNEEAARKKGRRILNGELAVLKGEVTSWGLFDAYPGQVIHINSPEHDIDREFRIAEIQYNDLDGTTKLGLAENTEGIVDVLVNMSEDVGRIDLRDVGDDVIPTELIAVSNHPEYDIEVSAYKVEISDDAFIWGEFHDGWGHPDVGGGNWGDQRDAPDEIDIGR